MKTSFLGLFLLLTGPTPAQTPSTATDTAYTYSPLGKRDPFQPILLPIPTTRSPFTLVGIVWDLDEPRALIHTPEGASLVLREGDVLSDHSQITAISDAGGVVRSWEYIREDGEHFWEQETLTLQRP